MLNVNSIDTNFKQINHPLHSRDMTGKRCLVCGNTYKNDPSISLHQFTSVPARRAIWLKVFGLKEDSIKYYHRVCSRHFPNGDPMNDPVSTVGKRFASPIKKDPDLRGQKIVKICYSQRLLAIPYLKLPRQALVDLSQSQLVSSLSKQHLMNNVVTHLGLSCQLILRIHHINLPSYLLLMNHFTVINKQKS